MRRNPTDQGLLNNIIIDKTMSRIPGSKYINYTILYLDECIGRASIKLKNRNISNIWIDHRYRNKGLATYLYNHIENDLRIKLQPSGEKRYGE